MSRVLLRILDTRISPELVPGKRKVEPAQKSEDMIGPYELQDFNLYSERNHQGIENRIIQPSNIVAFIDTQIQCRDRLGGMLKYYYREAA